MKSLINRIRKLNISNSVIEQSLGFDRVQLKAYNQNPSDYPIMTGRLKAFLLSRELDKYNRVSMNFLPPDVHKSSWRHDDHEVHQNLWSRAKAGLKRIFNRKVI